MKVKIRKGDTVEIISGKIEEKGKRGEVIKVLPNETRLVVQGLNIHTKHQKAVQTQQYEPKHYQHSSCPRQPQPNHRYLTRQKQDRLYPNRSRTTPQSPQ